MDKTPPDYEIRRLTERDAEAWRALRLQALKDHPEAFATAYEEWADRDLADFAARLAGWVEPEALFGLFVAGALEGSAGFVVKQGLKERHKGSMVAVYLRPHLRGGGLGGALVQRVIDHARERVDLLQAGVAHTNAVAKRTYFDLGFKTYGVEPASIRVDGVDHDEELIWLDFRNGADSLPDAVISDRRVP